jgi:hypothetical protein
LWASSPSLSARHTAVSRSTNFSIRRGERVDFRSRLTPREGWKKYKE